MRINKRSKYKSSSSDKLLFSSFPVKEATFYIRRHEELKETFTFASFHEGWFFVVGNAVGAAYYNSKIAFTNKTKEFDLQSSFVLKPYQGDDAKKNCAEEKITPTSPPPTTKPAVGTNPVQRRKSCLYSKYCSF